MGREINRRGANERTPRCVVCVKKLRVRK